MAHSRAMARSALRMVQWWGEDKCFFRSEIYMSDAEHSLLRWALRYLKRRK